MMGEDAPAGEHTAATAEEVEVAGEANSAGDAFKQRSSRMFPILGLLMVVGLVFVAAGVGMWVVKNNYRASSSHANVTDASNSGGQAAGAQHASKQNAGKVGAKKQLGYLEILAESRKLGLTTGAAQQMRQIGIAMQAYAQAHGGELPDKLEDIKPYVGGSYVQLTTNPGTGEQPGFVYEKPGKGANPSETEMLWETRGGTKYIDGAVLYADGHIEGIYGH